MKANISFDGEEFKNDIVIENHDLWSLDITLANIIHPALVEFRKSTESYPYLPPSEIPEEFGDDAQSYWQWILEEMIWSFEQISSDGKAEEQFYSDEKPENAEGWTRIEHLNDKGHFWCNEKGMAEYHERINRGTNLFGKYYSNLWS